MSVSLSSPEHKVLYSQMREMFSDIEYFDELVADKLKKAIKDTDDMVMNENTVKRFTDRYFEVKRVETEEDKELSKQIKWIFKTLCVHLVSQQNRAVEQFWTSTDQLIQAYPSFHSASSDDLQKLLSFRNMVKATLIVIPARLNKQLIIDIAGRLEGTQKKYITGRGQSLAVQRRVAIYEQEGGIVAEPRPYRRVLTASIGSASPNTNAKRRPPSTATGPNKSRKKENKVPSVALIDEMELECAPFQLVAHPSPWAGDYEEFREHSRPSFLLPGKFETAYPQPASPTDRATTWAEHPKTYSTELSMSLSLPKPAPPARACSEDFYSLLANIDSNLEDAMDTAAVGYVGGGWPVPVSAWAASAAVAVMNEEDVVVEDMGFCFSDQSWLTGHTSYCA